MSLRSHLLGYLVIAMLALAVVACGSESADRNSGGLSGSYAVEGTNFDGSPYRGTVEITGDDPAYDVTWQTGSTSSAGEGTLEGDTFTVRFRFSTGETGTATYAIQDDGGLDGTWTLDEGTGDGTEVLTPDE